MTGSESFHGPESGESMELVVIILGGFGWSELGNGLVAWLES